MSFSASWGTLRTYDMNVVFKPAVRESIALIIGLAGGTGSGKTKTAMELATGLSGGKPFAVIDTERRRALHYAPPPGQKPDGKTTYDFQHFDLEAPFRPKTYADAIMAADEVGFPVIVVDSASHEWAGEGGIIEWQEEENHRMAGGDENASDYWKRKEATKMAAWIKPKTHHKKMVTRMLQLRAHLILCFRAEPKVEMVKDPESGKTVIVPKKTRTGLDGWVPICEKNLPFELTASLLFTEDAPGIPKPIKLQEQHRSFFPLDRPVTREAGRSLGEWAAGGAKVSPELDQLIADYAKCNNEVEFKRLETRRAAIWSKPMPAGYKARIKEAADGAGARVALADDGTDQGSPGTDSAEPKTETSAE